MVRRLMALACAAVMMTLSSGALAQENGSVVRVVGEGVVAREPDRAVVTVGASAQAETARAAQQEVNEALNATLEAIKKLEIDGMTLQTAGVSLSPVYANRNRGTQEEPRVIGYRASNTVSARFDDVAKVGEVLDAALEAGANEMRGVSFRLKDDSEAQREALKLAVEEARAKAEAVADAAGLKLGELVEIQEMGAAEPQPRLEMARAVSMDASTPIETGEIRVRGSVTVTYRLSH